MAPPQRWWVVIKAHSTDVQVIEDFKRPTGYETVFGPFATRAEAQKVAATTGKPLEPAKPPISIPNPLSGIGAVGHWLGEAVLHAIDLPMWRSIGWIVLGAILVMAGIYLWFRTSATYKELESSITGAVKAL